MFIFTLGRLQQHVQCPHCPAHNCRLQRAVLASRWRQQTRQPPAPGTALELGTNLREVSHLRRRSLQPALAHLRIYALSIKIIRTGPLIGYGYELCGQVFKFHVYLPCLGAVFNIVIVKLPEGSFPALHNTPLPHLHTTNTCICSDWGLHSTGEIVCVQVLYHKSKFKISDSRRVFEFLYSSDNNGNCLHHSR